MSKSAEEIFNELDPLYQDSIKAQVRMKALEKEATEEINILVLKHYPEIHNLEKEGFDALVDAIWRVVYKLVLDVENITYKMQIKK